MMTTYQTQATHWLQETLGHEAHFREGQWEAIEALVEKRQRMLVVQRTGWGKSLVYFLATRLLRAQGAGPTILISPLLSLMRNQIASAAQWGLTARSVNSTNAEDHHQIEKELLAGKVDLLLISPERLANDRFQAEVWPRLRQTVGLLVVDEAHCISDWGHDFRPNYRRIMRLLAEIPAQTPIIGTTATANDRVVSDVAAILGAGMNIQRGTLTRDSLKLYTYAEPLDAAQRLTLLAHLLKHLPGSGIIYCTTTRDCQLVAAWLQNEGFKVKPYFADVEEVQAENREALEDQLIRNQVKALVSSVALGMGFDKSDLHFVIHFQLPGNIISYYQQIGRAGRGIAQAHIILMHGPGDEDIQRYFIDTAFPKPEQVQQVITALQQHPHSRTELQAVVNARVSTLEKILTLLEVEQIIEKRERDYVLLKAKTTPDYSRWEAVTRTRYAELAHMQAYLHEPGCLMHFLASALDDPQPVGRCGRCMNCTGAKSKFQAQTTDILRAQTFLRQGQPLVFEPRKRWPGCGSPLPKTTQIHINQPGIALCGYYDEGWGIQVREGRAANHYSDVLIEAAAAALRLYWQQEGIVVSAVIPIPSRRRPALVPDFAERLARVLGVPYRAALQHTVPHPPQAEMHNSFQQALNVWSKFEVLEPLNGQPLLLVDDIADSKWTLTVAGDLLQRHGSGPIFPFVLAATNLSE
ncbi:MAG TPA: RecQ family ATP-dependent DNA helicase [Phototrophicaceae bacterium]|nr:RecQ family ATP-dependent DNA helicase [Phototrophicaceae bacterium]